MGNILFDLGHYQRALDHWQHALDLYRSANDNRRLGDRAKQALSLHNLGAVHHVLGHRDRAVACYTEQIAIAEELGDRPQADLARHSLATARSAQSPDDQALSGLRPM
jgi:tetratricopeptide (TPR) repeat protein